MFVQEHCAVWSQPVLPVFLCQKTDDDQIVTQYSRSTFRCLADLGDFRGGCFSLANRGEQVEVDCGFDRFSSLVSIDGVKQKCWSWCSCRLRFRSHNLKFLSQRLM